MSIIRRQKGFTILELIAVLTVLSIATIMVANHQAANTHTMLVDARAQRAIQVSEAVKTFRQRTGSWPLDVASLVSSGDLIEDSRMRPYAEDFSLHDISGNRITVRYNVRDQRIARRLAGTLPHGALHSNEVVNFLVDRPGFEASLAAITEAFYRHDGTRPLTGNMNAGGHNISNVERITANELRGRRSSNPGYVRPDGNSFFRGNVDVDGTASAYDLRAENRVYGRAFYDSDNTSFYVNPSSNSRVSGYIQADGEIRSDTFRSRTNSNYYLRPSGQSFLNQLEVANDVTAKSFRDRDNPDYYIDPSNSGRSANLGGRLATRGIEFTGTGSVGGSCSSYEKGITVTSSGSLLYCDSSNEWAAVGGQSSFTARNYSMINSSSAGVTGSQRTWSFTGEDMGIPEGTYAVQIQIICHVADPHNVLYQIESSAYTGTLRLLSARASGSGDDVRAMNTMTMPIDGRNGRITITKPAAAEPCDTHRENMIVVMNGYFRNV